jgi:hypothetical protein
LYRFGLSFSLPLFVIICPPFLTVKLLSLCLQFLPEHMQRQNKPFEIPLIRASEAYEKKLEDTKAFY